jgi:Zn-dependent M28 family amino/carboxypeptidase
MQVAFDAHTQPADGARIPRETEIVNVVAVLPGAMPEARARRYYVVGHYDSRASDPLDATSDAPGANDDASGVAVVLEAARVLSKRRWDATLVFLATAGEEQGLYGAKLHAKAARAAGLDVRAVLNDDIVGDPTGPGGVRRAERVRLFSEGLPAQGGELAEIRKLASESDSASRETARFVAEVGALYALPVQPTMVFRADRFLRGGDHLAFNEQGFAAVRFTTVEETYERQHQNVRKEGGVSYGDVPAFVDGAYLADVARLNAATLAHLANAPSPPPDARILVAELGHDIVLRWSRSPEPDVAGYEVVWRPTTSATWTDSKDVGNVTEVRLPLSKDDLFLGVRAYDKDGYRSPVVFLRAAQK